MPEWLIWSIVAMIWIGIQVSDFGGCYSISEGIGGYIASPLSGVRDGVIFLIICWGLYQGQQGYTTTMGDVLFFTCPWIISKVFKTLKIIKRIFM